jgi:dsDNA-specific endonuclease/ATPase MutS2
LEVSEEKANQRVEEFKRQLKSLTAKLKEAENRAELAEKTVKKLQKEVDRLEGNLLDSIQRKLFLFLQNFFLNIKSVFWDNKKIHAVSSQSTSNSRLRRLQSEELIAFS